jgi:hypothetical protein
MHHQLKLAAVLDAMGKLYFTIERLKLLLQFIYSSEYGLLYLLFGLLCYFYAKYRYLLQLYTFPCQMLTD